MRSKSTVDDITDFGGAGRGVNTGEGIGCKSSCQREDAIGTKEERTFGSGMILELRFKVLDPPWTSVRRGACV